MKKNVKRVVSLLLATVLLLALCACNQTGGQTDQPQTGEEQSGLKLWWAYNTENLMQDLEYDYDRDYTLRMHGIKGDVESIQLMITPDQNVAFFDFKMNDVTTTDGAVISAEQFDIFAEHYLEVTSSYNVDSYYGMYPDALVPIENFKLRHHNAIAANNNQGIWINANIPADAAAGFYTGTGVLTLDDEQYTIPVELTVYNAVMPEEVHAQSSFLIWYDYIGYGEGYSSPELMDTYYWFFADKRLSACSVPPSHRSSYDVFVDYLAETIANDPRISNVSLPYESAGEDGLTVISRSHFTELLNKMVDKNIELRKAGDTKTDLFKKAYLYLGSLIDEPGAADFPQVKLCDLIITQVKLEVAERLNDYPDLKESLLGIEHLVTVAYVEELVGSDTEGGVQCWCPQFQHFHTEAARDRYKERQTTTDRIMHENVWWYGCIDPEAPFPTYHLDDNLVSSRTVAWMQYDYGIEGNLYWAVNYWVKSGGASRDIWTDPQSWSDVPGEGNLVYPGKTYGLTEPITTLRLESVREGQEDYEYFYLIDLKIQEYNEKHGTELDTIELLQPYFAGLYKGTIPTRDNETFNTRRLEVLALLDGLNTDLDATVASLTE